MDFYWIKTNKVVKWLFSSLVWSFKDPEKTVYLTFDDGPTPEITNWILDQLNSYNAKATFFCIGNNIKKHPHLLQAIAQKQHRIGNHTFCHTNGWKTTTKNYVHQIDLCQQEIEKQAIKNSFLFRPPYGKIKFCQAKKLKQMGYKIIMYDVLSADFDNSITPDKCLQNVLSHVQPGSIIVFHDSYKAATNLQYVLPKVLQYLAQEQYLFKTIEV